jgi:hypothetical protein
MGMQRPMAKTRKADKKLYDRLRNSGVRKRAAKLASQAGPMKTSAAEKLANELEAAADVVRKRAGTGSDKRSKAAKKAARTRRAKAASRGASARQAAKTRS